GTTVEWNTEVGRHTVWADDGAFQSDMLKAGGQFSHTFDQPGVFHYYCDTRLGGLSWFVATDYAGINTSKMCSQLCPWANSCSTSLSRLCNASRAIVRTRCPMVLAPCANANLSVSDPEAGACWSNDCATQLKRKWRLTASSLRTCAASKPVT